MQVIGKTYSGFIYFENRMGTTFTYFEGEM